MLLRSVCSKSGRINLIRSLTNRILDGVFGDSASLFSFFPNVAAEKTSFVPVVTTEPVLNSVVKIFTVSSEPDIIYPWKNKPQKMSKGSGFVISGKRIITNAHVVANHKLVQVIKHGSTKKYIAQVKAIGHECDLAILIIESNEFWEDLNPLEFGDLPFLKESVVVIGYPIGGDNISITKGVVSRIEPRRYCNGGNNLLAIQIDAAINHGNSGGPVCIGNKVVGVVYSGLRHSNNIGYLISTPVIKHFISGVEKTGHYVGFCSLNISYQAMEDSEIRNHFKMNYQMTGILINHIYPFSDAYNILKKDDIILAIDGVSIENDGTVILRDRERIMFDHLISMKKFDETTLLKVLRYGKIHEFNIILKPVRKLVPFDNIPSYYIFAGFVFMTVTQQHLHGSNDLRKLAFKNISTKSGEQNVIISQVLADVINAEYVMFRNLKVKNVNNVKVENLKHLYQLIEKCCTKDLRLDLGDNRVIILDYQSAKKSTSLILERHRIPSAMSKDLINSS